MKTALITGSTRGIGLQIAKMFYKENYKVIITGTKLENVQSVVKSFNSEYVTGIELDLTKPNSISKFKETQYNVDVLINNAGMLTTTQSNDEKRLRKMFDVNVIGPIEVTEHVLPNMIKNNSGHILFFCPPYAIDMKTTMLKRYMQTKLAQTTYMMSTANQLKNKNINVVGFWTKFPIFSDAIIHRNIGEKENCMDPSIISETVKQLINDDPNKIRGKVFHDHDYLISKNIDPKQFALGNKTMFLDELFFKHLSKK